MDVVIRPLREDELEVQVESEANQYIPFALEEVNLDFQVVGPSPTTPDEQEVLIAATRGEIFWPNSIPPPPGLAPWPSTTSIASALRRSSGFIP